MTEEDKEHKSSKFERAIWAVALIVPLIATPTIALGIDQKIVDYWNHIAECGGWLINDQSKHSQFCLPSFIDADALRKNWATNMEGPPPVPPSSSSSSYSSSFSSSALH